MARPNPDEGMIRYAQFSGLRNTVPVEQLGLDDLDAASNCDIDDAKRLHRRMGHGAAVVSGAVRSLWSDGRTALAVRSDTTLVSILPSYALVTLRIGLMPGLDMSYAGLADRVYYSNGAETGVVESGASRSWGLELPAGQPDALAIGGTLPAGRYQYAVTFLRGDGQESGTPRAALIELAVAGGIRLVSLPTTDDSDVSHKVVYFTKCNGETLYRVGLVAADATSFDYQVEASMQVPLRTQGLGPAPAGQIVRTFNGYTLVASGNTLRRSESYAPELFDLRKGHVFPGEIVLLEPVTDGVYVGTADLVAWLPGTNPEKWEYQPKLAYGAIRGAVASCSRDMLLEGAPASPVTVFATTRGICMGENGGAITNLTQERFLYPVQERGAAVVRRHRGTVQTVLTMRGAEKAAPSST